MRRWHSLIAAALAALIVAVFAGAQTGTSPGDALDAALGALQAQIDENDAELADHEARIAALEAAEPPPPPPPPAQCANELDDDGDGLIDLADPGCVDAADDDESDDPPPPGDTEAPSAPGNLRQTGATETTISVAWDPSSDNVGVEGYNRFRDGVQAASVSATPGHTFSGGGMACGEQHEIGVEAFDAAGNVSGRVLLTAATAACTEPDPDLPPLEPNIIVSRFDGSGSDGLRSGVGFVCDRPINVDLLQIEQENTSDAVQLRTNCTGRIGRLVVDGFFADCVKVNPPQPHTEDLEIGSGYCYAEGPPLDPAIHQDCIQAGGGERITFRNFVFDCIGGGGGNYFVASFNGGSPDLILCEHCAFGPRHPNQIRTPSDVDSGASNSLVCESTSGRETFSPASGDKGGNIVVPANDPSCTIAELRAYTDG